jgi:hypothetical protein
MGGGSIELCPDRDARSDRVLQDLPEIVDHMIDRHRRNPDLLDT